MDWTRSCCLAVTLTFKVTTQMLCATRRLNMVIISVKYYRNLTLNNSYWPDTNLLQGRPVTLTFKIGTQMSGYTSSQHGGHFCKIVSKSHFK